MPVPRIISSSAPTRICDIGGWTDTWFARHGRVFNIAIEPRVEVELRAAPRQEDQPRLLLHAEAWSRSFEIQELGQPYEHDPIVEAAVAYLHPPDEWALELTVSSQMPEGAATGSSSSIIAAVLAAVDRLTPGRLSPHEIARAAHDVEAQVLGQQAGVQDGLAACMGGVPYIEVSAYPEARASSLPLSDELAWELERRLALVYVGQPHDSSRMHEQVIRGFHGDAERHPVLERLRELAVQARDALSQGDLSALGQALTDAHEAQAQLHQDVVEPRHEQVIDVARRHGALGWKVNGAGGPGGSVSLLMPGHAHRRLRALDEIRDTEEAFQIVPVRLSRTGLRVWEPHET